MLVLHSLYKQKMSIALQKNQAISIFKQSIDVGEAFFGLVFFQKSPPISLFNLLVINEEFKHRLCFIAHLQRVPIFFLL